MDTQKAQLVTKLADACLSVGLNRITTTTRFGEFLVDLRDSGIGHSLLRDGAYGYSEMMRWFQYVDASRGGGILLDVGGNIGTTCIPLAQEKRFREIHSFEPEPGNFSMLAYNVSANGLSGAIHVHHLALGDRTGTVTMELSQENAGDHRVRYGDVPGLFGEEARRVVTVPCTTLDLFLRERGLRPGDLTLVKADVEGSEARVLLGAQELLSARQVPWIVEFWPYALDRALVPRADFVRLVQSHFSSFVEMARHCTVHRISDFAGLFDRYQAKDHCDLVLLP